MKKNTIVFLLVAIFFTGIGALAVTVITADDIEYDSNTTVKQKIDSLYTTQTETVSNLEQQLNEYQTFTQTLRAYSWNTTDSVGELYLNDYAGRYKYFKIIEVVPSSDNEKTCKATAWASQTSTTDDLVLNTEYEIMSNTDGKKYSTIKNYVAGYTTARARCDIKILFYN